MTDIEVCERKMFLYAQRLSLLKDELKDVEMGIKAATAKYEEWKSQLDRLRGEGK